MIKWGIIGCGKIARKFANDIALVQDAKLIAVASRSKENADAFAKEFNAGKVHYNYESLVADRDVDAIYIATPHAMHFENTMLCLRHNKAVLCEKAFAINKKQVQQMIDEARSRKVFLMEALWTKFLPNYNFLIAQLQNGLIGEIKSLLINFGFRINDLSAKRLTEPALGGGTLLDIGIYNVFMALSILGKPDEIEASATLSKHAVDEQCAVLFKYKNGAMAQLFSTFLADTPTTVDIGGTKGRLHITHRFYAPFAQIEYYPGAPDTKQIIFSPDEKQGWGYQYQIKHVCECLQNGLTESPVMKHQDSLELIETLDTIRNIAGIKYPLYD